MRPTPRGSVAPASMTARPSSVTAFATSMASAGRSSYVRARILRAKRSVSVCATSFPHRGERFRFALLDRFMTPQQLLGAHDDRNIDHLAVDCKRSASGFLRLFIELDDLSCVRDFVV